MSSEVLAAIIALISAFLGGFIQYYLSQVSERQRRYAELRTESYKMFFQSMAMIAPNVGVSGEAAKGYSLMAEAKARIALYGSPQVVKKMAIFFKDHAVIEQGAATEAFIDIAEAMRTDSLGANYVGFRADFDYLLMGAGK